MPPKGKKAATAWRAPPAPGALPAPTASPRPASRPPRLPAGIPRSRPARRGAIHAVDPRFAAGPAAQSSGAAGYLARKARS
jgi:hypothetical protein